MTQAQESKTQLLVEGVIFLCRSVVVGFIARFSSDFALKVATVQLIVFCIDFFFDVRNGKEMRKIWMTIY